MIINFIKNLIENKCPNILADTSSKESVRFHFHEKRKREKKENKFYFDNQKFNFDLEIYESDEKITLTSALIDFRSGVEYNELIKHLETINTNHPALTNKITYEDDSW